jgi:HEAT repeat protein
MDIAYALGRAGDKRGPDALAALLTSDRDARLYAAKRLAQLHDKRAVPTLVNYLGVSQNRLGVAAWLAPFEEPQALKALDEIRSDAKSPDKQAEAAIALGNAKHPEVTPQLRALLANPEWKGPAARALAELHDPAARPVLVEQLGSPQLRVDGALALRRLEPNLDAAPLLEPLVAALDADKDLEQIHVAEAILLLAGPADIAEFD